MKEEGEIVDEVHEAFDKALEKINPEVAALVRQKFAEDEQEFLQAAKNSAPFKSVYDWATSSCNKCYGRGFKGWYVNPQTHKAVEEAKIPCTCTTKNYRKWLKEFRVKFNEERGHNGTEKEEADRSEDL